MKRKLPDLDPRPAKRRILNDEERVLWEEAMAGKAKTPSLKKKEPVAAPKKSPPTSGVTVRSPLTRSGNGMDRRTADKLRRGKMKIEGTLDLHGMKQAEAHAALLAFIGRAFARKKRMLLVITGKGTHSRNNARAVAGTAERGVLKEALPRWLSEAELRQLILAITPAQPKDGGDGAFYVLLRRGLVGGEH